MEVRQVGVSNISDFVYCDWWTITNVCTRPLPVFPLYFASFGTFLIGLKSGFCPKLRFFVWEWFAAVAAAGWLVITMPTASLCFCVGAAWHITNQGLKLTPSIPAKPCAQFDSRAQLRLFSLSLGWAEFSSLSRFLTQLQASSSTEGFDQREPPVSLLPSLCCLFSTDNIHCCLFAAGII